MCSRKYKVFRGKKKSQQWVSYCLPSSGAAVFTSSLLLLPHIASTQMSNSINLFKPGGQHGCGPRRAGAAFAAPARPLSPACYCCCHFINKAITLERGGGNQGCGMHINTHVRAHTHTWGRYSVSLHWGGGGLTLTSLVQRQGSFMGHRGAACMK